MGAVMWLGESFWPAAGVKKELLRAQRWLQVDDLPGGVVRIRAAQEPFAAAAGQAGEIQPALDLAVLHREQPDQECF